MERGPDLAIVRVLLQTHAAVDASEAASLQRIRQLVDTGARPFSREQYVPGHLTASALVVDAARTQTLLIFHAKLQRWLQPGGHFEPGENDPRLAATREVMEETRVRTKEGGRLKADASGELLDVDVHMIPARKTEPAHEHFDLRVLLVAAGDAATAGDGVTQARWVKPAEFAGLELDPGLQRALRKVFREST